MRKKFEEQLSTLNDEMIRMGTMIEENIQKAIDSLVKNDIEMAKDIMGKDELVDKKQKEIETLCFHLLIQQQPVARDLRVITAAMKMVTDMERIGDHAADISEMTLFLADKDRNPTYDTLLKMAAEASVMLIQSIDAYTKKDREQAREVIAHDDVVDALFCDVKRELVELIRSNPDSGELEIDLLMVAKYLERIGVHATNIAEWVIYSLDDRIRTEE